MNFPVLHVRKKELQWTGISTETQQKIVLSVMNRREEKRDPLVAPPPTAKAIPFPSVHSVRVHISEDLWASPLTALQHVFLPPTMSKKPVAKLRNH